MSFRKHIFQPHPTMPGLCGVSLNGRPCGSSYDSIRHVQSAPEPDRYDDEYVTMDLRDREWSTAIDRLKRATEGAAAIRKATDKQVGGDHYSRNAIQPIEYIVQNGLDWYSGNVVKYITRFRHKNGKQDLEKVIHYAQLAMEHYYPEEGDDEA